MVSHNAQRINSRVDKLLSLARQCGETTLVASGKDKVGLGQISVIPYANPTGLLRLLGLVGVKRTIDKYLFFPSTNILYVRRAVRILRRRIERDIRAGKRVVLITCVPHHDICLAGLQLKQRFKQLQWIIDWQDLWSYDERYFDRVPEIYRERLLRIEKSAFMCSDINITTNEFARSVVIDHYHVPPERVISISHHYSHEDFAARLPAYPVMTGHTLDGKIKVGFLGNLFKPPKVPGEKVIRSFCRLSAQDGAIELHVFGDMSRLKHETVEKFGCESLVFHKRTGHRESLKNIAQCDFLLLVLDELPSCRTIMHQKLPHYLLIGKPILAIVPRVSAVAAIIRETGSGIVIPADIDWDAQLAKIFRDYRSQVLRFTPSAGAIEAYNWENVAKMWLKVIGCHEPHQPRQ
jgi:glycosyltransferase involved in cell wall biosynthesis